MCRAPFATTAVRWLVQEDEVVDDSGEDQYRAGEDGRVIK
jgi:hypothetical protein